MLDRSLLPTPVLSLGQVVAEVATMDHAPHPGPRLGRRSLVVALSGLSALPLFPVAAGAATSVASVADLVAADGGASPLAMSLAQTVVSVRGYLAPGLDGRTFTITDGPVLPCQLCGAVHDAGPELAVQAGAPDPDAPVFQLVRVSGRVETQGGLRLVDASLLAA